MLGFEDQLVSPLIDSERNGSVTPMTVGVAAVCENGQAAVLVADRMRSYFNLSAEEGPPKIAQMGRRMAAAISWSDAEKGTVMREYAESIKNEPVEEAAKKLKEIQEQFLDERRDEKCRSFFGATQSEMKEVLANAQQGSVGQLVCNELVAVTLPIQVALAGWSEERKRFRVFAVNSQSAVANDSRDVVRVGSGGDYAFVSLVHRGYSQKVGLADAILAIYEAKKIAELADGVGKRTDMLILRAERDPVWLDEPRYSDLDEIVGRMRQWNASDDDARLINSMVGD